jgi:uncharacterized protein with PIN domain
MAEILFHCDANDDCNGEVSMESGPERDYEIREGVYFQIPENFPTATCSECGEVYLDNEELEQLEKLYQETFSGNNN